MDGLQGNYQIATQQPSFQGRQYKQELTMTPPKEIEDGDKKLKNILMALGATAVVGIGLYKTGSLSKAKNLLAKKGTQATQEIQNTAQKAARQASDINSNVAKQIQNLPKEKVHQRVNTVTQGLKKSSEEISCYKKVLGNIQGSIAKEEEKLNNLIANGGSQNKIESIRKTIEGLKEQAALTQNNITQITKKQGAQQQIITDLRAYGKGGQEFVDFNRLNKNRTKHGLAELTFEQFQKLKA